MRRKVVVSPSAYRDIEELAEDSAYELIVTTTGLSYAMRNGLPINYILDTCSIRSFGHKVPPMEGLPVHEWEALLLARDLNALLLTKDSKAAEEAVKLGVELMQRRT
ncbi:hypothetical protein HS1genome_0105 [Sulfodiicoccus acidiphilus]|uniref:PIN domain-containing protein n=1 Tax=Sulfodiicoccus acidiphilus TaxID=1670455 RepID=A0A348B0L4_9CREN|nr:hypothetical protein [Sulfodiicoccus acidiphilus]BBD71716.1 hypothetical protein HS1genome_0105 [Sulfodiicoccus acidiphilus]GGT86392.1 hypothetical protein GCM10007116_00410 [Sulfodiicoccus acidiphilus]